jgi:hypothetical protein
MKIVVQAWPFRDGSQEMEERNKGKESSGGDEVSFHAITPD